MNKAQYAWTTHEVAILVKMVEQGRSGPDISKVLNRNESSVRSKASALRLKLKRGGHAPKISRQQKMIDASNCLREAINALFERMPARVVAEVIGKPHLVIPGMERVYRGQLAERRLAA